ncbi:MAG: energy transducer TonB [Candidatus Eisenbacteria bacterium]|uniref:Energy transducer TonB n=1 Tax=Eiseniibacteriota bacterium TaxID=2212470 RepID=A0A849SPY3_UNCEI|nr:energy transducer TonB [Candidatus Eisenbacteria bacterium]
MTRTVVLHEFMPYGAPDLQSVERRHLIAALSCAMSMSLALFLGLAPLLGRTTRARPVASVRVTLERFETTPMLPPPADRARPLPPVRPTPPCEVAEVRQVEVAPPELHREPETGTPIGNSESMDSGVRSTPKGEVGSPAELEVLPELGVHVPRDEEPVVWHRVAPEYPEVLKLAGFEGRVTFQALIGRDGRVARIEVMGRDANPMFENAARAALLQWRFEPARAAGHPVAVWVAVPFRFTLR